MKQYKFAFQISTLLIIALSIIACDKDFATLDSDIINDDIATNFDIDSDTYNIITYNDALGPVQTNNLGLSSLGVYDDAYGRTTSSFLTQLVLPNFDPEFGEEVVIDSVVLNMPYFSLVSDVDDDANIIYEIDSVFGNEPFKLSLFESNYFLRDFDPDGEFDDSQPFFSNKSASESETFGDLLEGTPINILPNPENLNSVSLDVNGNIRVNDQGYKLTQVNDEGETEITLRQAPGIRIKLDPDYWQEKIIDQEGNSVLSSQNNFSEFLRGIYFKVEPVNDDGSFIILNAGVQIANITIHYTRLTIADMDDEDATEQVEVALTFGPNRVNFFDNNFTLPLDDGDAVNGDARLYLKGGEGSIAKIKLFNGDNLNDGDDMTFDDWRNEFVEVDEDGEIRAKRLVNEANLVFHVDQDIVQDGEPDRIYLYDVDNKIPLVDYFFDVTNNTLPSFSKLSHLGPLQRVDDEPDGEGIKYKLRITEHINNLLLRDSTNVELGLAVSVNINLENPAAGGPQRQVQDSDDTEFTIPVSSIMTPRGTVLHGNNTEDESRRVYLEIFYTEPNN
ncbi:DUF4270 domain-containing protein [Winogradskyella tangerina]|uniref:DUF4270 domain-containing protein n=1 Tax=Winogradskyella tangerina TaxID=2023240 RepID=UPI000DBE47CD|nr:DUF4270 domain-containing protein [Winogradskyella tangerina]